ncbi:MAG: hypothetical protein KDI35_12645, partial [Gammaproteobacteria bacterium]|nr:hypothetical protein [Gammaproteobacteria bacterium]
LAAGTKPWDFQRGGVQLSPLFVSEVLYFADALTLAITWHFLHLRNPLSIVHCDIHRFCLFTGSSVSPFSRIGRAKKQLRKHTVGYIY